MAWGHELPHHNCSNKTPPHSHLLRPNGIDFCLTENQTHLTILNQLLLFEVKKVAQFYATQGPRKDSD